MGAEKRMLMADQKENVSAGSSFDDFLREEGIYEEVTQRAIERVKARLEGQGGGSSGDPTSG